jgi:hypothetical protein
MPSLLKSLVQLLAMVSASTCFQGGREGGREGGRAVDQYATAEVKRGTMESTRRAKRK